MTGSQKRNTRTGRNQMASIQKNIKEDGARPSEEGHGRGGMGDTAMKSGKRNKNVGGKQTKQGNAPERAKRHIDGNPGRKNKRGGKSQEGKYAQQKREQGRRRMRGRRNRRSRK